jgi:flavocytochrome c
MLSDTGSSAQRTQFVKKDIALTVPYAIKVVIKGNDSGNQDSAKTTVEEILDECFAECDKFLNNFNPASEVSHVNSTLAVGKVHKMSPALSAVMKCAEDVYRSSNGAFDPACAPLLPLLEPGDAEPTIIEALAKICTFANSFKINFTEGTLVKLHSQAKLDLGGISKGYTVDCVVEKLVHKGFSDVYFEWGGDCRAHGTNPSGSQWVVGVQRPPSMGELRQPSAQPKEKTFICVVKLDNEALCTSGDYENLIQGLREKGTLCIRTFDSKSKRLISASEAKVAQVTVKGTSAMYADALATAALVKSEIAKARLMLERFRYHRHAVTDYIMYVRASERVGRMHDIAKESQEMRDHRIAGCLPCRVIVVGGGLAGLSAAIEAASCGAQVILLEKASKVGGNSAKATSGINGWGSRPQALQGVNDESKYFERDTFLSGVGGICDPGLVALLSVKSSEAIQWLTRFGIPLTVLSQLGGHSRKRTHRAPDKEDGTPVPIGYTIMHMLEKYIRTNLKSSVTILTDTAVTGLLHTVSELTDTTKRVRVHGVTMKQGSCEMNLTADSVILATGGHGNDRTTNSLLSEFSPHLSKFPTTNGTFASGDGVKMARAIGAHLVDMDKVQLHPTGLIDPKDPGNATKYLGPEALRGSGGVLLNTSGQRFVNELDLRSVVSAAIIAQNAVFPNSDGCNFAYCVLNKAAVGLFGLGALKFYWKTLGLFEEAQDIDALAKLIGCKTEILRDTLTQYASSCASRASCPLTGKRVFPCVVDCNGPFYVSIITPSIHYTMGGCLISPAAEIQSIHSSQSAFGSRRSIQALFGAGEVTGGVHGMNRLGGNSLLECVVFGRIAGDRAATILQRKPTALSFSNWVTVVLREVRHGEMFGQGSAVLRFNLPGALQSSGLMLGQYVAIRGDWDGQQLIGYYSPITLPDDQGVIGILARTDKGTLKEWISALRPGDAVEMKGCGGLTIERVPSLHQLRVDKQPLKKIAMIAGGTGVAPMIQIIRAALKKPYVDFLERISLIYAAEEIGELTYRSVMERYEKESFGRFSCTYVLNHPPPGWVGGVGFVDRDVLQTAVPQPSNDLLIAICGPPVMQRAVVSTLLAIGHQKRTVRTIDEEPQAASQSKL